MKRIIAFYLIGSALSTAALAGSAAESPQPKDLNFTNLPKPITAIITDVDGTLTNRACEFFELNVAGFRLANMIGVPVYFITGRSRETVLKCIGPMKLKLIGTYGIPGIYLNGSQVLNAEGKLIHNAPLKPEVLEMGLQALEDMGELHRAQGVTESGYLSYDKCRHYPDVVYKLHVEGDPETVAKCRKRLEEVYASLPIHFAQSHDRSFQVLTGGFDKGTGVKMLAAELGIPLDQIVVIGDGKDDIPMFEVEGVVSVAPGNAYDVVKDAADFVTVPMEQGPLFEVVWEVMKQRKSLISRQSI